MFELGSHTADAGLDTRVEAFLEHFAETEPDQEKVYLLFTGR